MKRSYVSGSEKRKKQKEDEEKIKKYSGSLCKFLTAKEKDKVPPPNADNENFPSTSTSSETATPDHDEHNTSPPTSSSSITTTTKCLTTSEDPAQWPSVLGHTELCAIVTRGPIQVKDIVFSQNSEKNPRRFTKEHYKMVMKNGEKIQRTWLLYSVSTDSVFCFACKRFGKLDNALTKGGFRHWKNLASNLKEHEYSKTHITNMKSWHELQMRLKTKTAIDQINVKVSL
ncbi:hypothetical protein AAFF_G00179340 [Aldrovandia affinis]|uniref:TTF-type domain-containing protein n=1 Tax=Aldrovandia affinis TaxID=143900 RepID=A0AAD7RK97_9TELE|nr:hypothetical protein AAFF_G00179340 [Aldrovandia affinis]